MNSIRILFLCLFLPFSAHAVDISVITDFEKHLNDGRPKLLTEIQNTFLDLKIKQDPFTLKKTRCEMFYCHRQSTEITLWAYVQPGEKNGDWELRMETWERQDSKVNVLNGYGYAFPSGALKLAVRSVLIEALRDLRMRYGVLVEIPVKSEVYCGEWCKSFGLTSGARKVVEKKLAVVCDYARIVTVEFDDTNDKHMRAYATAECIFKDARFNTKYVRTALARLDDSSEVMNCEALKTSLVDRGPDCFSW